MARGTFERTLHVCFAVRLAIHTLGGVPCLRGVFIVFYYYYLYADWCSLSNGVPE